MLKVLGIMYCIIIRDKDGVYIVQLIDQPEPLIIAEKETGGA